MILNAVEHVVVRDGQAAWACHRTELCAALDQLGWTRTAGCLRPPSGGAYRDLCAAVAAVKGVKGAVRGVSCARPGDAPPSELNEWDRRCLPALRRATPASELWFLEPAGRPVPQAQTIGEACRELMFDAVREGDWGTVALLNDVLRPPGRDRAVSRAARLAALEQLDDAHAGAEHPLNLLCILAGADNVDIDQALMHVVDIDRGPLHAP